MKTCGRLLLLVSCAALCAAVASGSACYPQFASKHSGCLKPNPQCTRYATGVSASDKALILKLHNDMRSKVARGLQSGLPKAANMNELKWDNTLAEIAQAYANQCVFAHDCADCRRTPKFEYVGQNLYTSMWSVDKGGPNWNEAMNAFYNEVRFFNAGSIKPFKYQSSYGHFTQLMWAETMYVGCGYTKFKGTQYAYQWLYACNYAIGGNLIGGVLYEQGATCSKCTKGCTSNGLCRI